MAAQLISASCTFFSSPAWPAMHTQCYSSKGVYAKFQSLCLELIRLAHSFFVTRLPASLMSCSLSFRGNFSKHTTSLHHCKQSCVPSKGRDTLWRWYVLFVALLQGTSHSDNNRSHILLLSKMSRIARSIRPLLLLITARNSSSLLMRAISIDLLYKGHMLSQSMVCC